MAQTGFTPILHYASATAGIAPDPSFLTSSSNGAELAINYTDGKLFYKDNAGAVQVLAWKTTPVTAGGTGLNSLTAGYIPFGNGTSALGNSTNLTYTSGTSTLSAPVVSASSSMASAGNMLFSGTAARIQGDFSSTTLANRTAFQDKTTNNETSVYALPNGTSTTAGFYSWNNSNPTNAAYGGFGINSSLFALYSGFVGSGTAVPMTFNISGVEVARFSTSGNYLLGSASSSVAYDGASWKWVGYQVNSRNTTADTNQIVFFNPNGSCGFINTNVTATSYNSVSDYRLKDNVQPMTGALAKVQALNPVTYTWKSNGSSGQGFIAHELQAVIPEAATGAKDAVDEEGNPRYQGVDTSHVVATLVAAVKELSARVAKLEAK
jgi:hypothetical protein